MVFEIHKNKLGHPFLKKVDRPRLMSKDGRGMWVEVGRVTNTGIERVVRENQANGNIVLIDEDGIYRTLILTE